MCGIGGAIALSAAARADLGVARALAHALRHRGPDGEGARAFEAPLGIDGERAAACLAHARLAVIDRSLAAAEPLSNEDGSVWLVANGEIYNHRALRQRLEAAGHRFRSATDVEVLLHLYEEEGPALAASLSGMYAFALLDLAQGRLVLARDPQGEKPLFRWFGPDGFVFASEPLALFAASAAGGPRVPRAISEDALAEYLAVGYVPAGRTIFGDVEALVPGETLVFADGRVVRSFAPRFGRAARDGGESPDDVRRALDEGAVARARPAARAGRPRRKGAIGAVRDAVRAAVHDRLEADVPVGAFLSGGIDSTIVCGLAREALGALDAFTVGFEEPAWDETREAAATARALGLRHHVTRLSAEEALAALPALVWYHGQPFADESGLALGHLARFARPHVTVALTGDGGDELFYGYRRARLARLYRALDAIVPAAIRRALAALAPPLDAPGAAARRAGQLLHALAFPEPERYLLWTGIFPERGAGIAARVAAEGGVHGYDLAAYLPCDLLAKSDRASMAHGLEARAPLLDRRVAALAATLPRRRHSSAPWRAKELLVRAFADLVPRSVAARPKRGLGVPIGPWLRREPWLGRARDLIGAPDFEVRGIVTPGLAARLVDEHARGAADHARRIYALMAYEVFAQQVLDPPVPTPLTW